MAPESKLERLFGKRCCGGRFFGLVFEKICNVTGGCTAKVGRVLNALSASHQADHTVVAVLSDHGWKLGEFGLWGKHTVLHADVHVPLMVYN